MHTRNSMKKHSFKAFWIILIQLHAKTRTKKIVDFEFGAKTAINSQFQREYHDSRL